MSFVKKILKREKDSPSVRDETHTMHAIPMIPNEDHDYGSRNFNQRDKKSINPVSFILEAENFVLICLSLFVSLVPYY